MKDVHSKHETELYANLFIGSSSDLKLFKLYDLKMLHNHINILTTAKANSQRIEFMNMIYMEVKAKNCQLIGLQ